MKTTEQQISKTLTSFAKSFIDLCQQEKGQLPQAEFEPEWISPCQVGEVADEHIHWQPVIIEDKLDFENVESALELTIHPEYAEYATSMYSESIPAKCEHGLLELLFPWNQDDFSRLQENLIGHVLMKRKLKQDVTLFFAVTDEEDVILVVHNDTGEVWAERVGCQPHKKLADNLNEFILSLLPTL